MEFLEYVPRIVQDFSDKKGLFIEESALSFSS